MRKEQLPWVGLLAPVFIAAGGIIYSITGEMGNLPLAMIWIGLLALLLLFHLHFSGIRGFFSRRSTKYGANMALMIAVFVTILGMIGAMSVKYKMRVDLTANKRYSLSQQTVKLLKSLKGDVEAVAFYRSDERTRQVMVDLLSEYSYHSPKFTYWFVDPDKRPAEAAKYGVTSYRTTLIRSGDRQETVAFESENKVTNALMKVVQEKVKTVYFIKGHGENLLEDKKEYGYATAKQFMEQENYRVLDLLTVGETPIPDDAALVVVSGPRYDLSADELAKVDAYIHQGGSLLFMLDPAPLPGVVDYLKKYGFNIGSDIVVDKLIRIMGTNYLTPVVMEYNNEHAITRDLTNTYTFFPIARSVEIETDPGRGRYSLAKTSASSWARSKGQLTDDNVQFDPERDRKGPISVMSVAAVEITEGKIAEGKITEGGKQQETSEQPTENPKNKEQQETFIQPTENPKTEEGITQWGRIIVIGDSNFAGNTHIKLAGNRDLFLNAINWLAEEEAMISVRKKETGTSPLTLTTAQGKLVFWLSVIIMPSLFLVIGMGVVLRRRETR